MTAEIKENQMVALSIISVANLDIGKAYNVGFEIAKETNSSFQGIFIWGLLNPNRDAQYLFFFTSSDTINNIIEKAKLKLGLTDKNLLFTVTPQIQPSDKPAPSIMTT